MRRMAVRMLPSIGAALLGLLILLVTLLPADVVKLRSGGIIRGRVLENESDQEWLTIELDSSKGAKIRIKRSDVAEVLSAADLREEYQALRRKLGDDFDAHLELARWCYRYRFRKELLYHLKQAAQRKPDDQQLRLLAARAGYLEEVFPEERSKRAESLGLVRDRGRLVTPQQKKLAEARRQRERKRREWIKQIAEAKKLLLSGDRFAREGVKQLLHSIDDPLALDAVLRYFIRDDRPALRSLGCLALARIGDPRAGERLVELVLEDESEEVRWAAIDALKRREDSAAVRKLIAALRSSRNHVVRWAAVALGELAAEEAVPALIDALVTDHVIVFDRPGMTVGTGGVIGGFPVQLSGTAGEGGGVTLPAPVGLTPIIAQPIASGGGIQSGGRQAVRVRVQNPEVLEALKKLTGEDHGFDKKAWKQWYRRRGVLKQEEQKRQLRLP